MRNETPGPGVQSASTRQWWLVLTGTLSAALLIGSGWWWTQSPVTEEQSAARLCDTYPAFVRSMYGRGLDSQAQRQFQITKLIALAQRIESAPQPNAEPVKQGSTRLQGVLDLPSSTYREAYFNARPIAVYCGFDPRTGQVAGYLP